MKRHPQLRGLSDDHHTALVVALRCQRAGAEWLPELWRAVADAMGSHFEPHFGMEEAHLVPALKGLGESDLARRLLEDHAALRELARRPAATLELAREFGSRLELHVRFEEREVFEPIQDRLPRATLEAIERACAETPRSCGALLLGL